MLKFETSSNKKELLEHPKRKQCGRNKIIFVVLVSIIIILSFLNLWQAGCFDSKSKSNIADECSGHGRKYNDLHQCECYECYSGANCEVPETDCMLSAASGQPFLLSEYWTKQRQDNKIPSLSIPIDWRMPYDRELIGPFHETAKDGLASELSQIIRRIHAKYNNVNITNTSLIFGQGASQLTTAAFYAYSRLKGKKITAFAANPYYFGYDEICYAVGEYQCQFNASLDLKHEDNIVEIVTFPNNPDGWEREQVYKDETSWAYDLVYHWPHYVDELQPLQAPISMFSLTKLTGHASTRFGWAFVQNGQMEVANTMAEWIAQSQRCMTVESVRRAYQILSHLEEHGDAYFDFIDEKMTKRWEVLVDILDGQNNYVLRSREGTFFAWIECEGKNETEIVSVFGKYNISPRLGSLFGQPGFVRMNMAQIEEIFDRIMIQFRLLVDSER
eukprot:107364_1